MPPVRWKTLLFVTLIAHLHQITGQLQDSISMTSDGWRPIIGSGSSANRRPSQLYEEVDHTSPHHGLEADHQVTNEAPAKPKAKPKELPKIIINSNNGQVMKQPHAKLVHPNPYYGSHGPHIPIGGAVTIMHKRPLQMQLQPSKKHTPKRGGKPPRTQSTSHSLRDEIYVQPPNSGSYSYISHGNTIKTRETQGLGHAPGGTHYINHAPSIDFNNRYTLLPNDNVYLTFNNNPVQDYILSKAPHTNEVHFPFNQNDEYTRNLVPPPHYKREKEKLKKPSQQIKFKDNVAAVTENSVLFHQSHGENVLLQVPPPFEQKFSFSQPGKEPDDVQVTKEKLKTYHNQIPNSFKHGVPEYIDFDYHHGKVPQAYEVTEPKPWEEQPTVYRYRQSSNIAKPHKPKPTKEPIVELNLPPFLPTPYRPDNVLPTSPTQTDASTVFSQVSSKMNKHHYEVLTTNPLFFDVREVSTHYPILGRPEPKPTNAMDLSNEVTTRLIKYHSDLENEITTPKPVQRTRMPSSHRRRRPTSRVRPTQATIEAETEPPFQVEVEKVETTERPARRRPHRHRTSTTESTPMVEELETIPPNRHRLRKRPTTKKRTRPEAMVPNNHKSNDFSESESLEDATTEVVFRKTKFRGEDHRQKDVEAKYSQETYSDEDETKEANRYNKYVLPSRQVPTVNYINSQEDSASYETTIHNHVKSEEDETGLSDEKAATTIKFYTTTSTTTEPTPTTTPQISKIEEETTTKPPIIEEITVPTTLPPTTTETTTQKPHHIRTRPNKYDNSNRPRFSVKDYRQRLNQYMSSTSSTTEPSRSTPDSSLRNRYSNRLRSKPTPEPSEDSTDPPKNRFRPKSHSTTPEPANIITEKYIKSINTRLRPFGRYRSTTDSPSSTTTPATPTQKVSIKPNLFSQRRRPQQISLRTKVFNKLNKNKPTTQSPEPAETTLSQIPLENEATESRNEVVTSKTELPDEESSTTMASDIYKIDPMLYSQRVSDLTSSFKNEYNTPGMFKSVSPTSRRIPSYFTISTEDPILPIEAFFPNLMDKEKE